MGAPRGGSNPPFGTIFPTYDASVGRQPFVEKPWVRSGLFVFETWRRLALVLAYNQFSAHVLLGQDR